MSKSSILFYVFVVLIISFSIGTIFERRGWIPGLENESDALIKDLVNQGIELSPESLGKISNEQAVVIGESGDMVTVFSNIECPACAHFHETMKSLASTGRYRFSYRNLVIGSESSVYQKHRILMCSHLSGESIDGLFDLLYNLPKSASWLSDSTLNKRGIALSDQVQQCVKGETGLTNEVDSLLGLDLGVARSIRVRGTPSWIVGNKMVAGSLTPNKFEQVYKSFSKNHN